MFNAGATNLFDTESYFYAQKLFQGVVWYLKHKPKPLQDWYARSRPTHCCIATVGFDTWCRGRAWTLGFSPCYYRQQVTIYSSRSLDYYRINEQLRVKKLLANAAQWSDPIRSQPLRQDHAAHDKMSNCDESNVLDASLCIIRVMFGSAGGRVFQQLNEWRGRHERALQAQQRGRSPALTRCDTVGPHETYMLKSFYVEAKFLSVFRFLRKLRAFPKAVHVCAQSNVLSQLPFSPGFWQMQQRQSSFSWRKWEMQLNRIFVWVEDRDGKPMCLWPCTNIAWKNGRHSSIVF